MPGFFPQQRPAIAAACRFFLAAGGGVPEHLIAADPDFWVRALVSRLLGAGASLRPDVMDEYVRCFRDPRTIAGLALRDVLG